MLLVFDDGSLLCVSICDSATSTKCNERGFFEDGLCLG